MENTTSACRICLALDVKLYHIDSHNLRNIYEEVLNVQMDSNKGLPQYFCYMCTGVLKKYHNFRKLNERAQLLLINIINNGLTVTEKVIRSVDREANNLITVDYWCYNKNVQSVVIKTDEPETYKKNVISDENVQNDIFTISLIEDSDDGDNSESMLKSEEIEFDEIPLNDILSQEESCSVSQSKVDSADSIIDNVDLPRPEFIPVNDVRDIEVIPSTSTINKSKKKDCSSQTRKFVKVQAKSRKIKLIKKQVAIKKLENPKQIDESLRRKSKDINSDDWEVIVLTEEEQIKQFNKRLSVSRYRFSSHPCELCKRGFADEDSYNAHKIHHDPSLGQFECWLCKMRFRRKSRQMHHMATHVMRYNCKRCLFTTCSRGNVSLHDKFHAGVEYECEVCHMTFSKRMSWMTHRRVTHRSDYICAACGENFLNQFGIRKHQQLMHSPELLSKGPPEGSIHCDDCNITLYSERAYDKHLITSAKHAEIYIQGPRLSRPIFRSFNTRPKRSILMNKKPDREGRLIKRRAQIICHICKIGFREDQYVRHFKTQHPTEEILKRYMCDICGYCTTRLEYLETHLRRHGEKSFACNKCDWKFSTQSGLHRHKTVHTKEKRHECRECGKRFTQSGSLKLHYRTVHLREPYPKRDRKKEKMLPLPSSDLDAQPSHSEEFCNTYQNMFFKNVSY